MAVRVLVVDDEKAIADALAHILQGRGYECRAAYNGRDAMRWAEEFHPDILIADIVMPGMSGIELAAWFVREQPQCRVLLNSANLLHFDPSDLSFPHAERVAFMPKPMRISELLEFLQKSLAIREPLRSTG